MGRNSAGILFEEEIACWETLASMGRGRSLSHIDAHMNYFPMSVDSSPPGGSAVVRDPSKNTTAEAEKVSMYRVDTAVNVIPRTQILKRRS